LPYEIAFHILDGLQRYSFQAQMVVPAGWAALSLGIEASFAFDREQLKFGVPHPLRRWQRVRFFDFHG
jgi:hypothetical protein